MSALRYVGSKWEVEAASASLVKDGAGERN